MGWCIFTSNTPLESSWKIIQFSLCVVAFEVQWQWANWYYLPIHISKCHFSSLQANFNQSWGQGLPLHVCNVGDRKRIQFPHLKDLSVLFDSRWYNFDGTTALVSQGQDGIRPRPRASPQEVGGTPTKCWNQISSHFQKSTLILLFQKSAVFKHKIAPFLECLGGSWTGKLISQALRHIWQQIWSLFYESKGSSVTFSTNRT